MGILLRRLGIAAGIVIAAFALSLTNTGQAIAQNIKPVLVQVVNTATAPVVTRDLFDFAARNAFSEQIRLDVTGSGSAPFTIPAGKRLVVECVSVSGFDHVDGGHPAISLSASVGGGVPAAYHLTPIEVDPSGLLVPLGDVFASTQLLRLYADSLDLNVNFAGDVTLTGSFIVTVSGYLVDQP
jgi:hypothetical protein